MILRGYDQEGKKIFLSPREAKWHQTWRSHLLGQEQQEGEATFSIPKYQELVARAQAEMVACSQMLGAIEGGTLKTLSLNEADVLLVDPLYLGVMAEQVQRMATLREQVEQTVGVASLLLDHKTALEAAGYKPELKPYGLLVKEGILLREEETNLLKPHPRLVIQTSTDIAYCLSPVALDGTAVAYVRDAEISARERRLFRAMAREVASAVGRQYRPRWSDQTLILDRVDGKGLAFMIGNVPSGAILLDAEALLEALDSGVNFVEQLRQFIIGVVK